jgi:hypothetical protein
MLCEECHQSEATVHRTEWVQGVGMVSHRDLCSQCDAKKAALEFKDERCKYCGRRPNQGDAGHFLCSSCGEELARFTSRKLADLGNMPPNKMTPEQFTALGNEADEHMRKWASKKRPKQ